MSDINTLDGFFEEVEPTIPTTTAAETTQESPVATQATQEPLDGEFEETQPNISTEENNASTDDLEGNNQEESKDTIDYKAVYDRIFGTPIKAAGKEIKLQNPDEVVRLIQMGTDYNRKMGSMKAERAMLSALKASGLDSQDKINQMIDVMNGVPEAIQRLVADKGITEQLADIDEDDDRVKNYKAQNHVPDTTQLDLQDTLDKIQATTDGVMFVRNVLDTFDESSREFISSNPQALERLHQDKVIGNYDIIMDEVERLRAVGDPSIAGLNSLNAYATVGNRFVQSRGSNQVPQSTTDSPKNSNMSQTDMEERRRQVVATKGRPSSANKFGATTVDKFVNLLDVNFDELDEKKSAQINSTISQFLGASHGRL